MRQEMNVAVDPATNTFQTSIFNTPIFHWIRPVFWTDPDAIRIRVPLTLKKLWLSFELHAAEDKSDEHSQ